MKFAEKDKPVRTIPKGVWESSRPKDNSGKEAEQNISPSTDLQGNGYPRNDRSK